VELSWGLLLLLLALLTGVYFWHDSLAAREAANEAASETCAVTGAALLDGTVAFRSLRVVRGDAGQPQLERTYLFDYSTDGNTRRQGFVVVSGRRVESVGLQ
jgi:Protein of unknown function (DUF3301)